MRVTAQWIILGWLILFVNKKDCSQTSCKSALLVPLPPPLLFMLTLTAYIVCWIDMKEKQLLIDEWLSLTQFPLLFGSHKEFHLETNQSLFEQRMKLLS
jgi:hypothetical protein